MEPGIDQLYFLPETGETSELFRTKNWDETLVGEIADWPQSLRSTLGLVMHSAAPMAVFWGPKLVCFYNDSFLYVTLSSGIHPQAFAQSAMKIWPGVFDSADAPVNQVMLHGRARQGKNPFTLSASYPSANYSPVFNEDHQCYGVVVTLAEMPSSANKNGNGTTNNSSENPIKAIRKEAATLRSIILQAPFAMSVLKGENYVVEMANKHALQLWGRTHEEVIGRPILEVMSELESQGIKALLDEVYTTGKRFSATELPVDLLRDGKLEKTYINFSYEPFLNEDGTVESIMPVGIDVTAFVNARRKAEESTELLSAMVESAPFPIGVYVGEHMYIEIANKTMLDTWGKGFDVIGKSYMEILPELDNQQIFDQLKTVYDTGVPFHSRNARVDILVEGRLQAFYFNYSFTPLFDSNGKVYGIMNTAADVTDLNIAKQRVESSEQHLNLAIAASNIGTGEVDFKTQQLKYNGRYLDIFGFAGEQSFPVDVLASKIHPDDLQQSAAGMKEAAETGIVNFTLRVLMPDNAYHWLHARGRIYLDKENKPERLMGTLRDVTPEKIGQQQLEENEARLQLILEACGMAPLEYRIQTDEFIYADKNLEIFGLAAGTYYTRDELLAMFHPGDTGLAAQANMQALTTGMLNYEARIIWPDKSVHWIHSIGKVFYDTHGVPQKILGAVRDVTAERNHQEQMKENNERLNIVIDASELGIYELFLEGDQLLCSDRCLEIYGHNAMANYDHKMLLAGVHPADLPARNKAVELAVTTGILDYESRVIWPDGSVHWVHALGKMFFDEAGKPFKMLGTVRDITKDKKYKQEIKENEEKLQIVIGAAELGMWEWDAESDVVTWSDKGEEIFGLPPGGSYQQSDMMKFFHPDDLFIRAKALAEAFKNGVLFYAVRIILPDGSLRWIEVRGKVFFTPEHQPNRMLGTIRDITKERTYQQQLRERERHFRMLANAMPQLVWVANKDGVVTFYNRRIAEFAGAVQLPDGSWKWDTMVHPADVEATQEAWQNSLKMQVSYSKEHRVKMKNGEYRWFLSRAKPQKDSEGNISQWFGSATDIHEIKEQDQQKDFFINLASHELKTPITSVKGYTQLLQHAYQNSEDQFLKNSLEVINKQVSKLTNLIADLLDLSKIKSGTLPLNQEHFNLPELVQEVIDEMSLIHQGHSIQLKGTGVATVFADRVRIGQVLINLLTNAIKYSPNVQSVIIDCQLNDGHATVSVQDFGIGISPQEQEKIFQRFYRVEGKSEKTFPGFGIGLFISAEIVHRHNGTIGVSSEKGEGATFYFTLPVPAGS